MYQTSHFHVQRVSTAGQDPAKEHIDSLGYDSDERQQSSIFHNWDSYSANEVDFVR